MPFRIGSLGNIYLHFFFIWFRKTFSQLTSQQPSGVIINAYIKVRVKITQQPNRELQLPFDYSREDFLEMLKSRMSIKKKYRLIGQDFLCYYCDSDGALVELQDVTNLQSGTSIFLHDDSFCKTEFLELLEKVGCESLSAIFAYAGVVDMESLIANMNDQSFRKEMKKVVGNDMDNIFRILEKVLKGNK